VSQITEPFSGGVGADLGNYGNKGAVPGQGPVFGLDFCEPVWAPGASRRAALALRERLWSVSSIPDVRKCGKVPRDRMLALVGRPGGARLTGLCTCHSVWVCPICAPEIRAARGFQIARAVATTLEGGSGVSFGTGTLSHGSGHSLRSTYSLVVAAWGATYRDYSLRRFREQNGYSGFVRTTEVTHGVNGWHPHLHWLDFWEQLLSAELLREYEDRMYRAWAAAVARLSDRVVSRDRGVLVLPVASGSSSAFGNYLTEMSINSASFELTSISTKKARLSGLSPFEILAKVYGPGSKPWVDLWWEYESATRGRRMLGSSRGLLARLGLSEDDPVPSEVGEVVAYVSADDWSAIRWFNNSGLAGVQAILEAAAVGGQVAVDEAVRILLGLAAVPVVSVPDSRQLELGPGDDGGMF
jgi:hypothetical protein